MRETNPREIYFRREISRERRVREKERGGEGERICIDVALRSAFGFSKKLLFRNLTISSKRHIEVIFANESALCGSPPRARVAGERREAWPLMHRKITLALFEGRNAPGLAR